RQESDMPRTFNNLDESRSIAGEEMGTSEWFTVTQEQINQFADATGEHQWIHVDPDRAAPAPFRTTTAQGTLACSEPPARSKSIYHVDGLAMGVNYGANKVRFPAPVPVNSRIRATATLLEVSDVQIGAQFTIKFVIELEGSDKPASIAEVIYVMASA